MSFMTNLQRGQSVGVLNTAAIPGACAGAARAALDISRSLRRACPPEGVGVIDVSRVVIGFVDERPKRKSEEFGPLALTALGYRWPC